MATQFHVAYSENLVGAGIMSAGPWNCAGSMPNIQPMIVATSTCMDPCKYVSPPCPKVLLPDASFLVELAEIEYDRGLIGDLKNIKNDQIYIFSGLKDKTVKQSVVDTI